MNERESQPAPTDEKREAGVSRREFVTAAAAAGAGFMIVPRHVLGQGMTPPSDLVNIATVGINGMGASNTQAVFSQNIVAICDCDFGLLENKMTQWKNQRAAAANPPAGGGGRQGGAGGAGGGQGRAGGAGAVGLPPGRFTFTDYGTSKAQQEANAKWTPMSQADGLARFVDQQLPKVAKYKDYREMLEKQKDIDGVIVATPDHMHAVIASAAMDLGKHVYVQKPMCWSVHEARHLAKKAAEKKVVTQMGNQGHSQDGARRGQEYLKAGVIGDVREVHIWTNRPLAFWPQGVPRPTALDKPETRWNNAGVTNRLAGAMAGSYPVPPGLSWDLFLGVAPDVEYHPLYHPFNWRGWVDWGQGALGDMGAHLVDHAVWGLKLGLPTTIETVSTPFNKASFPNATTTYYEFAAREGMPPVKLVWYDGGLTPPRPEELGTEPLNGEGGVLYIGSKGKLLQNTYGARPRLLPADLHNSYGAPKEVVARVPHQSHEMNWVNAIRGRDEISAPFSYSAHLTEIMLLGVAALRANARLTYDGANMRFTNNDSANEFLTREYRQGFSL